MGQLIQIKYKKSEKCTAASNQKIGSLFQSGSESRAAPRVPPRIPPPPLTYLEFTRWGEGWGVEFTTWSEVCVCVWWGGGIH